MNYLVKKFFSEEECESIIDFSIKNGEEFSYKKEDVWDCRRIYDEKFKLEILEKIINIHTFNEFEIKNVNLSLTQYYEGRRLDLHLDGTANYTIVIALSDGYEDGRFVLSDKIRKLDEVEIKLDLKLGEGVIFNGNKTYHGVMPVYKGRRYALNIWLNDTDFSYYKLDKKHKLI